MNSLAKGRVIRAARDHEDVFILGESTRETLPTHGPLATASDIRGAAEARAATVISTAQVEAASLVASAGDVRSAAYADGYRAGLAQAEAEVAQLLEIARAAAVDGKAIRDSIAEDSVSVVARAAALATRRIVGEYYEADPARTAAACADALRAAAGQDVLAIRVHPGLVTSLQASLADAAGYIRPDGAVDIGGCIIDLRNGTLDATLEARLSLMDLAFAEAGGEVQG